MDVVPQNVHWLMPEESVPCDIFLHFRGQFPLLLGSGMPVNAAVLEKLAKIKCTSIYLRRTDLPLWEKWATRRHQTEITLENSEADTKGLYGNKRSELISYIQKSFYPKDENDTDLGQALKTAQELLQKVVRSPMLDWYFHQFHEPPHLLHHNARVAISSATFAVHKKLLNEKEIETAIFSSLIHELEGDPTVNIKFVVSQQTLATLEKSKHPVPEGVIELIRFQDELCSGKGFPKNCTLNSIPLAVRIFTLFNHLDHYKMQDGSSRRARFERAKQTMTARETD